MIFEIIGKVIATVFLIVFALVIVIVVPALLKELFDIAPNWLQNILGFGLAIILLGGMGILIYSML